jgi:hypothetical protein
MTWCVVIANVAALVERWRAAGYTRGAMIWRLPWLTLLVLLLAFSGSLAGWKGRPFPEWVALAIPAALGLAAVAFGVVTLARRRAGPGGKVTAIVAIAFGALCAFAFGVNAYLSRYMLD